MAPDFEGSVAASSDAGALLPAAKRLDRPMEEPAPLTGKNTLGRLERALLLRDCAALRRRSKVFAR